MSGVSIEYKGNSVVVISDSDTKRLKTNGKYCEDDIIVKYEKPTVGEQVSGTKTITENGTHDVSSYANANVSVPIPSGYIQPSGTKIITANGTHDVATYANVNVNVPSEIPITDLPITHCVYIAKGVLTIEGACELLLQGSYQFIAGAQNRHGMCISRPQTYARSNALQVTLAGDMADGSISARWMRVDSTSIKGGSLTTQQLIGYVAAMYQGKPQDVTIYLCDEDLYNANPSAYPQLVDITQMVTASTGTLVNAS